MGRNPKVTKYSFLKALGRHRPVTDVARDLGIDRRTVYKLLRRWNIDRATLSDDAASRSAQAEQRAPAVATPQPQVPQVQPVEPKGETPKPEPERNILKLPISDFTGARLNEIPRGGRRYY